MDRLVSLLSMLPLLVVVSVLRRVPVVKAYSNYACESEFMYMVCPTGNAYFQSVIFIRSATFGRQQGRVFRCRENTNLLQKCEMDVTNLFRYRCQGQSSCNILVELSLFRVETFCPEFNNYAQVEYECVAPNSLPGVKQCMDKCMPAPSFYNPFGSKFGMTGMMGGQGVSRPTSVGTQFHLAGQVYGGGNNAVLAAPARVASPAHSTPANNVSRLSSPSSSPSLAHSRSAPAPASSAQPSAGPHTKAGSVGVAAGGQSRATALAGTVNKNTNSQRSPPLSGMMGAPNGGGSMQGAAGFPLGQQATSRDSLMARIGRMLGAMRSGRMV